MTINLKLTRIFGIGVSIVRSGIGRLSGDQLRPKRLGDGSEAVVRNCITPARGKTAGGSFPANACRLSSTLTPSGDGNGG